MYHLLGEDHLFIGKYLSLAIIILVMIGWRPRITSIFHWYVSFSMYAAIPTIDGGDQIISILTLLLIPVCLTDPRPSHWSDLNTNTSSDSRSSFTRIFIWILYQVIKVQVSIIYLHAAIAKLSVSEWIDGTDTYYWFTSPVHGAASWLQPTVFFLMSKPFFVVFFTWGTMIFELVLAGALFIDKHPSIKKFLLACGIIFHLGIVLIHGLVTFFCAMTGVLILYLYPLRNRVQMNLFKRFFVLLKSIQTRILFGRTSIKTT